LVSAAFYAMPFSAATLPGQRRLRLPVRRVRDGIDSALAMAAGNGWALAELPEANLPSTDPEMVALLTEMARRLLTSGATVTCEKYGERPLTASMLAIGATHRDQRGHLRTSIDRLAADLGLPAGSIVVDTANRLQGRTFEVLLAWHPLSGRRDASAFHLEAGRLCVLASRHRQACIIASRAGLRNQLEDHPVTDPVWLGKELPSVDGWEANVAALDALEPYRVAVG